MKLLWCLGTKPDPLAGLSHVVADNRFLQLAEDCAIGSGGLLGSQHSFGLGHFWTASLCEDSDAGAVSVVVGFGFTSVLFNARSWIDC